MKYNDYVNMAKELGAKYVVEFSIDDIAFDPRTVLKCLFGCSSYGKNHTCPNQRSPLSTKEYKKILEHYEGGIIIGTNHKQQSQEISYEIERKCFLDGHYFAFSLSDCALCNTCALAAESECRNPIKARPAFHSVGIDVFKTVRRLGLPINVLQKHGDEENWYSAVFIE